MSDLFTRWNQAIVEHFFREELAGKQVFLFVDDGLVTDIERRNDFPPGSFRDIVGADSPSAVKVAQRCLTCCDNGGWRTKAGSVYPPYLVFLALFSMAAGIDEPDLPDHAYYNRLRRYLGLPDGGQLPGFGRVGDEVWKDLERWATYDMDGSLGIFQVRIYGQQRHVGVPRSQTLLWEEEVKSLPRIFAAADLDPTDDPTDQVLVQAMERHARTLRRPTRQTLFRPRDDVLRMALLEVIRSELSDWDGSVSKSDQEIQGEIFGHLRLFLEVNLGRRTGSSSLRCTLSSPYPDHALSLTDGAQEYSCEELLAPWSTRLVASSGQPLDAASLNWISPFSLSETMLGWRFSMRGKPIRVFESVQDVGLPGWSEVSRLDHGKTFLIACQGSDSERLLEWGRDSCDDCQQLIIDGALPPDWHLFRVLGVRNDTGIRAISGAIGLPSSARLRLEGGVRRGRGVKYLAFAPPRIDVSGVSSEQTVSVGGRVIDTSAGGPLALPSELPLGEILSITVRDGERLICSQTLILLDELPWQEIPVVSRVDRFGETTTRPGISGAFADPSVAEARNLSHPGTILPPASKAVLLGRRPGETCDWPTEPWPPWKPIWAVTPPVRGRRHRPVVYCGTSIAESGPLPADVVGGRRERRRWKEETWTRRKRNAPPVNPRLRKLWNEYVRVGGRRA